MTAPTATEPPAAGPPAGAPAYDPASIVGAPNRRPWLAPVGIGLVAAAGLAYTAWQNPNGNGVFPQCPTHTAFGIDCPGCGGLRSVHALTHGDLAAAADHNILVFVALPIVALLWVRWLLSTLGVAVPRLPRVPRPVWAGLAVIVLAFTVVRNIGGVGFFEYLAATA